MSAEPRPPPPAAHPPTAPAAASPSAEPASSVSSETSPPANPLTPEEQMALFEQELKETDWGHQPC